jgi:hypothetical protein
MMFSRTFLSSRIWPAMSLVEAAGGKSQRKFGGATRDVVINLGQSAANGPMMDWNES